MTGGEPGERVTPAEAIIGGEPGERVTPAEAMTGGEPGEGVTPAEGEGATRRSGLRNPQAAVRGLGAGTLILEAVVLLLAIQPIRILGGDLSGWGVAAVIGLAVVAILLAGVMSRPWAWVAGAVLQAVLIACGLLHWSLAVLGIIFAGAWAYAAYVRKTILG